LPSYPSFRYDKREMGIFYILLLFATVIGGAVQLSGGASDLSATNFIDPSPTTVIPTPMSQLVPVTTTSAPGQNNLQLNSFIIATVTPTPTPVPPPPAAQGGPAQTVCGAAGSQFGLATGQCCVLDQTPSASTPCCPYASQKNSSGVEVCDAKPVIYLYPTQDTYVNVALKIPGSITTSIPEYTNKGWQHILASPNGEMQYHGNWYKELYYESATFTDLNIEPKNGLVVEKNDLSFSLYSIALHLGLLPSEAAELRDYWKERLSDIPENSSVYIGLIDPAVKDKIDHIDISPRPDTFIQFNLYFKIVPHGYSANGIVYPPIPPRVGFTAVEWGGVFAQ